MSANEVSSSPLSQDGVLVEVVAATAASTLLIAGIVCYIVFKYVIARERIKYDTSIREDADVGQRNRIHDGRTLEKIVVDANGKEVLYLQKIEGGQLRCFSTIWFNPLEEEDKLHISQAVHTVSSPHDAAFHYKHSELSCSAGLPYQQHLHMSKIPERKTQPPPPPPPRPPPNPPPPPTPPPPPPPPPSTHKVPRPPPVPKIPAKRNPTEPPPRQRSGASVSSAKPPDNPKWKVHNSVRDKAITKESCTIKSEVQMKMKPLHWEKVSADVDHSLVWNEINDGSLRFDDDIIEALFGYHPANNKLLEVKNILSSSGSSTSTPPAQIFILDPRKSQNTSIVLKSLAISSKVILDALLEGCGLNADILEKLARISPTQEDQAKILKFNGNLTQLAYAESFLHQILKSVPTAFIRINAMLFRSNYDPDILHLKESLQTLEHGCKELRARGVFHKLLEAILKAGNRMNAGTDRGNAQGFNLNALRKLSYVKSTDGRTTLLHFVVEQVARAEGKNVAISKDHTPKKFKTLDYVNNDQDSDSPTNTEIAYTEDLMLGLPILSNLSSKFSNVRKAATVDPDTFMDGCSTLMLRVTEIKRAVTECSTDKRGDFEKDMKEFIEKCEEELKVVREEQIRVMQLLKRTTEFYQAGVSKDRGVNPLQIFIFVKEFLDMVDQTCTDITRKLQKKNVRAVESSASPSARATALLCNLQQDFQPKKSSPSSSGEPDDDF